MLVLAGILTYFRHRFCKSTPSFCPCGKPDYLSGEKPVSEASVMSLGEGETGLKFTSACTYPLRLKTEKDGREKGEGEVRVDTCGRGGGGSVCGRGQEVCVEAGRKCVEGGKCVWICVEGEGQEVCVEGGRRCVWICVDGGRKCVWMCMKGGRKCVWKGEEEVRVDIVEGGRKCVWICVEGKRKCVWNGEEVCVEGGGSVCGCVWKRPGGERKYVCGKGGGGR